MDFQDHHDLPEPVGKAPDFYDQNTLQTDSDYVYTFLRIIAGIIVFPYGMQKLFGWFSAPGFGAAGIKALLNSSRRGTFLNLLPGSLSSGSRSEYCPYVRLFGKNRGRWTVHHLHRALIVHLPDGWTLNWFGSKKGEGIEYLYCSCHFSWSSSSRAVVRYHGLLADKMTTCVPITKIREFPSLVHCRGE